MKIRLLFALFFIIMCFRFVFSANLNYDIEFRTRFVTFVNKDLDSTRYGDFTVIDSRGQIGLKFFTDSNFYAYYQMEIGDITWGEVFSGGAMGTEKINIESRHLYIGYKGDLFRGKLGFFGFNTPFDAEFRENLPGIQIKFRTDLFEAEAVYAKLFNSTNTTSQPNWEFDFELPSWDDTHLYYLKGTYKHKITEATLYYLRLADNRFYYDYRYILNWIGLYNELSLGRFQSEIGFSLNFGNVTHVSLSNIAVLGHFLHTYLEYDVLGLFKVFGRMNLTSANDTNQSAIEQFQVIANEGRLKTDLGVLFGGSSYKQQSYFNSDVVTADNRKNITEGRLRYEDPGLFIIESGIQKRFVSINFETVAVFGIASTVAPVCNYTLLELEFDVHNKATLFRELAFFISIGYLLTGKALTPVII